MVSRFPNGSPINRIDASERALVASFNKDFTTTDLVGKLKAVVYLDNGTSFNATAGFDGDNFGLIIEGVGLIGLEIEGRNLYIASSSLDFYLFDIDYDQQHKKVWDINDAGYLLQMPDMILPGSPTKRYLEVGTSNDDDALYIYLRVNNLDEEDGYQPISDTAELEDEDVDSWFNDGTGSPNWTHIVSVLEKIMLMEYDIQAEGLSINAETHEIEMDGGTLNLFTDGSPAPRPQPVRPLQMTSRFPSGSPIMGTDVRSQGRILVCTFNRSPEVAELVGKLKAVFSDGTVADSPTASANGSNIVFNGYLPNMQFVIEGANLYYVNTGNCYNLWDIDFNEQHKRNVEEPEDQTYISINLPRFVSGIMGDELVLQVSNNQAISLLLPVEEETENPDIVVYRPGATPYPFFLKAYEYGADALRTLLENIIRMEFSNVTMGSTVETDYGGIGETTGSVNLLTTTTI